MDPVKPAATRARRLESVIAFSGVTAAPPDFLHVPFSLRPLMSASKDHSLRSTVEDAVTAFLSPALPIATAEMVCDEVLAELRSEGTWRLNARVRALIDAPAAFIIGFALNEQHHRWGGLLGALNFSAPTIPPLRVGTFTTIGASTWLGNNYEIARREGVTFRLVSSPNVQKSPRSLLVGLDKLLPRGAPAALQLARRWQIW